MGGAAAAALALSQLQPIAFDASVRQQKIEDISLALC